MLNKIIPDNIFVTNTTFDTYFLRKFYDEYVLDKDYYPYQFDGWSDKKYYGVLDNQKNVIYPKDSYLKIYSNSNNTQHKNLAFVTDAFTDLKSYTGNLIRRDKAASNSIYSKLNVSVSTENIADKYLVYINDLFTVFKQSYLDDSNVGEIKNIQDFCSHFIKFLKVITKVSPINRSAFIKSRLISGNINGLRISLANPSPILGLRERANTYIGDPEFDLFLESAGKFGFFVDKNNPWTIVSDLESPVTKKYASNYGLTNTQQIFDTCYHKAYKADLDSLKNVVLSFWNTFAGNKGFSSNTTNIPDCKNLFVEISQINQLEMPAFEKYFNMDWQLRLYLFSRILEEKIDITQNKFETLYNESININNFYDTEESLRFINKKVQELLDQKLSKQETLTSIDAVIKILSTQAKYLPFEGINF